MINKMIIPAILSADETSMISQVKQFDGLTDFVQVDVADGKFVNSITCRPNVLKGVLEKTGLELHLMVADPLSWLEDCVLAGAKRVYLQVETNVTTELITKFKEKNIEVFLAMNSETPVEAFLPYKDVVNGCLLLSVYPGKQGQEFLVSTYEKIITFRELFPETIIVVDGGINEDNIKRLVTAGADWLVCGSSIVNSTNPLKAYSDLKILLTN